MNTSAQPCATYFTLTFAGHIDGFDWYYMHINGGSECLNYVASIGGWVSDDSCVPGDTNEFWEHHFGNEWGNFTSGSALAACHDSNNAAIYASFSLPARCTINDLKLLNWPFYPF